MKHLRHGQLGEKMQVDNENCLHAILQVFNLLFSFQIGLIEGNTSNKGKLYEKVHMHCTSRQRYDKLDLNNSQNLNILLLGN